MIKDYIKNRQPYTETLKPYDARKCIPPEHPLSAIKLFIREVKSFLIERRVWQPKKDFKYLLEIWKKLPEQERKFF